MIILSYGHHGTKVILPYVALETESYKASLNSDNLRIL